MLDTNCLSFHVYLPQIVNSHTIVLPSACSIVNRANDISLEPSQSVYTRTLLRALPLSHRWGMMASKHPLFTCLHARHLGIARLVLYAYHPVH
jgi:hypothetical protein